MELVAGAQTEGLWQGRVAAAANLRIPFSTEPHRAVRLRLSFESPSSSRYDPRQRIEIGLPEGFLDVRRSSRDSPSQPDVFVYLIDTLRADLTAAAPPLDVAPELAAFAQDAVSYRNTWSASTWTLPSVVSMMTGVYPFRHHVMTGSIRFSTDNVPSLGELAADAGYDTVGVSQSFVAGQRFGVDTGFDHFYLSNQLNGRSSRSSDIRRLLHSYLVAEADAERPLFAYLHTVDPHSPYSPEGHDRRFADANPGKLEDSEYGPVRFLTGSLNDDPDEIDHLRAMYHGDVAYADRQFGNFLRMLRFLGLYDNSLIVLVSDHGEEFGEHGGFDHGRTVYEELLRVPLLIKYPRSQWAGETIEDRVSTVDIVPTILRTVGIELDDTFDGLSLRPSDLEARSDRDRRVLFAEVNPSSSELVQTVDYRTIVLGNLKCIESLLDTNQFGEPVPHWQVFDLGNDPGERQALDPEGSQGRRCRQVLEEWLKQFQTLDAPQPRTFTDKGARDHLRALGYVD